MRIDVLTAVPAVFDSPLRSSILRRAQDKGLVEVHIHNLHDFSPNGRIDDYPYGGGAGMVIRIDVVVKALRHLQKQRSYDEVILLTADGELLTQPLLNRLSLCRNLLLIAGHYKGIDDRIRHFVTKEISIGNYILTGGELPALVLIDGIVRLLPGVLSDEASALEDSFQDGLLSAPIYTRPPEFEGYKVPSVLLSGDHQAIQKWRQEMAWLRTKERRPELIRDEEDLSRPAPAEGAEAPPSKSAPASPAEGLS
ncbi:MAG: tRNA (guanosine(37)-N1)-methyltransferase TrmD [Bacteroidia bacterium]|nr:tRNA (guanosine(37)-N1)-methyltransferase TrmD [Bacteroidia bacterium]MCX7764561.1 tRNA (guanosine(37)-N1)-methyltransferase TrmD [Bacteroidia bacterium]MDW8058227.1 tRNA (guanosine(37)-N1)-methyltransferase TrmD [Bacteroidia bacterium]